MGSDHTVILQLRKFLSSWWAIIASAPKSAYPAGAGV
ncbi:hypothetical protein MES5069_180035 [Mesorhizobium escarrei]|uniref:Uncharacterized protein n=1 Tax=Mesorhizobium escarrei TaxID=666018 RepID=A0ABN8JKG3_9HYPH|nr:hypothetical protein MES5069_180035 [Mesorhizobium escarrei]